ncbi:MAG TPA: hypothetical protein PKD96_00470 [Candidatus Absconditabacterales bacterium]|nr:hypothetical protein [Candidatus Absconditabacterales bacterium]HMT26754.1 hypothetical protein [Candidatus Absconditabacterales bacterium]
MIQLIKVMLIGLWRRNVVAIVFLLTICLLGGASFLSSLALELSSKIFYDTLISGIEIILIGTLVYELAHLSRAERTAGFMPLLISRGVSYGSILMSFLLSYRLASGLYLLIIFLIRGITRLLSGLGVISIAIILYGIFFKAILISTLTLLVSSAVRPILTIIVVGIAYGVGHMIGLLHYYSFIQKNLSIWSIQGMVTKLISLLLPHLDVLSFSGMLYSFEENRKTMIIQGTVQNLVYLIILLILILLISKTKKNFIQKYDW